MGKFLNALSDCVDGQIHLYRKLLDLFHSERSAILASDLEELNRIIMEKEMLLQSIRNAELARRTIAEKLAAELGIDTGELTVSRLAGMMSDPQASRIQDKGARLKALIDEIQVASGRNRSLCLHALQFVSGSIKRLSALKSPNRVYHASGRIPNDKNIGRMLSGAV